MSDSEYAAKTREHARKILTDIWRTVVELGTDKIDPAEAAAAGIEQRLMSLEYGSHQNPLYFTRFEEEIKLIDNADYPTWDPKYEARVNTRDLGLYISEYMLEPLWGALRGEYVKPPGIYSREYDSSRCPPLIVMIF